MFHSQIAAPSARSSRHHRSLRPPPKRTPARFYVVSSGRAGLAFAAAAKSCSCSFYSPHKSNMLKRETKCGSIWLREEEGGSSLGAARCRSAAATPKSGPAGVRCGSPRGSTRGAPAPLPWHGRAGLGLVLRGCSPSSALRCRAGASRNWRHLHRGGRGAFFNRVLPCCCGRARLVSMETQAASSE